MKTFMIQDTAILKMEAVQSSETWYPTTHYLAQWSRKSKVLILITFTNSLSLE